MLLIFAYDTLGIQLQISLNDDGTVTTYALSYNDLNYLCRIGKSEGGLALYSWNFSYGPLGLEKGVVKDPYNQTLLTQDYTVSTDGTILSMTYTPTPNFGGSVAAGEYAFAYDPCGNMVLMTNASGDPQLSYDIDRATNGIVNTYNPGNMENIIGIGGKRGQLTIPGFGNDDMTLPIQRPGQLAVIGDNGQAGSGWFQDVDSSGSSPGITGPCGEVGTCGDFNKSKCNKLAHDITSTYQIRENWKNCKEKFHKNGFIYVPGSNPTDPNDNVVDHFATSFVRNILSPYDHKKGKNQDLSDYLDYVKGWYQDKIDGLLDTGLEHCAEFFKNCPTFFSLTTNQEYSDVVTICNTFFKEAIARRKRVPER